MIELEIESIRVRQETQQRAVVLKVKGTDTYLPIFIGPFETTLVAVVFGLLATLVFGFDSFFFALEVFGIA